MTHHYMGSHIALINARSAVRASEAHDRAYKRRKDLAGMGDNLPAVIKSADKSIKEAEGLIVEMYLERTERAWELDYGYEPDEMKDRDKELVRDSRRTMDELRDYIAKVLHRVNGNPHGQTVTIDGLKMLSDGTPETAVSIAGPKMLPKGRGDSPATLDDLRKWVDSSISGIRERTLKLYGHLERLRPTPIRFANWNRDMRIQCDAFPPTPRVSRERKSDADKIRELRVLMFGDEGDIA